MYESDGLGGVSQTSHFSFFPGVTHHLKHSLAINAYLKQNISRFQWIKQWLHFVMQECIN